ncbi:Membrane transport protein [Pseudodesulfovibrio hydrargyri]|uniref:Membrane transport protein n=1 Tax=Pseudodesulfovibrio hydrargyri TaxID=2125990 RepID=A0A1J5NB18_9BACT|nr:AEC family transporter [Pseudodesulfovibrio hydrargyri]OIQ52016.1 Membrane transport protein [Pseudodesulfovibrio hydrargyri]
MDNFLLLGICFALGVGLRVAGIIDEHGPAALNAVIIHMSLPALALLYAHDLPIGPELIPPAAMAWIVFGAGYALFAFLGRRLGWDRKTVVCLALTGGLGNTSFVGLPMIEAFYGPQYLGVGMLCDTAGSFMVLAGPGMVLAAGVSGGDLSRRELARKVLLFPPLIAIVLGFALHAVPYPQWLAGMLSRLGSTLSPLALLSVGLTLRFKSVAGVGRELAVGLGYKLAVAPVLILVLYVWVLGWADTATKVTVFEAGMGPMISGGIIAMTYGARPRLAATMLGIGVPLSILTRPLWYWLLTLV